MAHVVLRLIFVFTPPPVHSGTRVLEPVSCGGPYEVYHLCGRVEIQVENMEKVSKITFPSQLADS